MYFLWQRTPYGTLRISYSGLYEFLQVFMSSRLKIYSLALRGSKNIHAENSGNAESSDIDIEEDNENNLNNNLNIEESKKSENHGNDADLIILASSLLDSNSNENKNPDDAEELFAKQALKLMKPLGINTSVVWFNRGTPGNGWLETRWSFFGSPWLWMALASSVALVLDAGWDGLFWTAFWGTLAWFIVRGIKFLTKENMEGRRIFSVPQNSQNQQINNLNSQRPEILTHVKDGEGKSS